MLGAPPFVDEDPMGIYQQILAGKVNFPRYIDKKAKSLVKKLIVPDMAKRLGCLKSGADDIKKHKWLADYDFEGLLKKINIAPVIPSVAGENDTSNFDGYPDDEEEPPIPTFNQTRDPFLDF